MIMTIMILDLQWVDAVSCTQKPIVTLTLIRGKLGPFYTNPEISVRQNFVQRD